LGWQGGVRSGLGRSLGEIKGKETGN